MIEAIHLFVASIGILFTLYKRNMLTTPMD